MIWWLTIFGIFAFIAGAMYVPDWIRWAKWNRARKRRSPGEARDMRPPVRPPFWSSYTGLPPVGGAGGGWGGGGYDGGGLDCGGYDGGGATAGGCD